MLRRFFYKNNEIENPEFYGWVGTLLLILMSIFVVCVVFYINYSLRLIKNDWFMYERLVQEKEKVVTDLEHELGFGGLIQDIKNYSVRYSQEDKEHFWQHNMRIKALIQSSMDNHALQAEERQALQTILEKIQEYEEQLEVIDSLDDSDQIAEEIAALVRIDTSGVTDALARMKHVIKDSESEVFERSLRLQRTITHVNLAILILLPFFFITAIFKHRLTMFLVKHISERQEESLVLKQYKERTEILVQAIEACPIGITLADPSQDDYPLTFVNNEFEKLSGYSRDEVMGENCKFLQGPLSQHTSQMLMHQAIKDKKSVDIEIINYRKDGTAFWNNVQISPVFGEDGVLKAFVGTQNDITELKQTQERIEQERDFTKHIINTSPSLVVGLNANREVEFVNHAALNIIGKSEEDVIGCNWWDICDPQDSERINFAFDHLKGESGLHEHEMTLQDNNGNTRQILWTIYVKFDADLKIQRTVATGIDLTKERMRAKTEQQRHKLESLGTMAGGIAHEINNALQPIILLTEEFQLLHKDSDGAIRKDLDDIIEYALHARSIVEDVLLYSNQSQRNQKKHHVYNIIKQAIKFSRGAIPATMEIIEKFDDALKNEIILVDKAGFMQIISNLLNNASHAMEGKGQIRVESKKRQASSSSKDYKKQSYLEMKITDTGYGISSDDLENIFDPFFTTKDLGEGSGLGLSVVYGLIQEFDGNITVKSKEGEGTTFIVTIPLVEKTKTVTEEKD